MDLPRIDGELAPLPVKNGTYDVLKGSVQLHTSTGGIYDARDRSWLLNSTGSATGDHVGLMSSTGSLISVLQLIARSWTLSSTGDSAAIEGTVAHSVTGSPNPVLIGSKHTTDKIPSSNSTGKVVQSPATKHGIPLGIRPMGQIVSIQRTVTTSGVAERLVTGSSIIAYNFDLKALDNVGGMYIGASGVTVANGRKLLGGEEWWRDVVDPFNVWFVCSRTGEGF